MGLILQNCHLVSLKVNMFGHKDVTGRATDAKSD